MGLELPPSFRNVWRPETFRVRAASARRAAIEFSVNASSALNYFPSAEAWVDDLRIA
jgi:hypothetical protein